MAAKNSIKTYTPDTFYHIYNRGVEQRPIFLEPQDFSVFLSYLQTYLMPKDEQTLFTIIGSNKTSPKEKDNALKLLRMKNYASDIDLVCYALLPNHFHLLIKQISSTMNEFMNSLGTRYAMFFNKKYKRKGVLFQDVYKAVSIETDEQLLHVSRYIHKNPTKGAGLPITQWNEAPYPSSLAEYFNLRQTAWIKKHHILDYFSKRHTDTYENFMNEQEDPTFIHDVAIDDEIED